jgi:hypothetical protein
MRTHTLAGPKLLVWGLLVACGEAPPTGPADTPLYRAQSFSAVQRIPVELMAPTCQGVSVRLTGYFIVLSHVTLDPAGGVHVKTHVNPANLTGEIAGVTYRGTGVTQRVFNENGPLPVTHTFINNVQIIAQGSTNNLLLHSTVHITINANGTVTSVVNNNRFVCRG